MCDEGSVCIPAEYSLSTYPVGIPYCLADMSFNDDIALRGNPWTTIRGEQRNV